ncbi:MAG: hypothetical protein HY696_06380, partial [Deltaproteobacteria bacterium]|nr:hypothetical protein [Deltaproteobacteria bacterium]
ASALDAARRAATDSACAQLLAAWHAALHDLAVPLHPAGPRQAATALARSSGVSPPTIQTIQARLTDALTTAGFPVHADPEAARGVAIRAGRTVGPIVATLLAAWQEQPPSDRTAEAMATALDAARRAATDSASAQLFAAWHAALHDLAVPLHPAGPRQAATALARSSSVSCQTILTIQARLTDALTAAGIAVHADPEAARSTRQKAAHARRNRASRPAPSS